jgi:carbon-monoxide dehydrogenase large subunit
MEADYRYEPAPGSELRQGANIAVVEIDPRVGGVKVLQYAMSYAIGRAINPLTADGQVVGAIAQGVGGALLEDFAYSDDGQPLATSFMDYAMPTAVEVPPIDVLLLENDDPPADDPLQGAMGLGGGGGILGTSGAIANAVADALGDRGRELTSTPVSPELVQRLAASVTE